MTLNIKQSKIKQMKIFNNPEKEKWYILAKRSEINKIELNGIVQNILTEVKSNKDRALYKYSDKFENVKLKTLKVTGTEISKANSLVPDSLKSAIKLAKQNIEKFHTSQLIKEQVIETAEGVNCWRKSVAIEKVGLYIPGGSAPLFSSVLMLGIPAKLADCSEIIICTPPNKNGEIHPAILYTANLIGLTKIYKVGGSQAIAAMAYGTETIPQVYKIFGPGNQFVTKAKELAQLEGIAIDMPAGPSEVLVIADKTSKPSYIASDLLSQAEHGEDSQVILLSDNDLVIKHVLLEVEKQIKSLPRTKIAKKALVNSKAILFSTINECFYFSNYYAPEHLIIASENASNYTEKIINAGSVFLGNYSCESAGDYASGTNHTLPTNGFAKNYSGVSVESFQKKITFQKINELGIKTIGPTIEIMAEAEELFAHKNAVSIRLKDISNV